MAPDPTSLAHSPITTTAPSTPPRQLDQAVKTHSPRQLATHVGRGLATLAPRARVTRTVVEQLRDTLTSRDWWVLGALAERRVLTTGQLARLAFDTDSAARHRLHTLYQLRGVDRFRPPALVGSEPWHYVLDKAGAILLAERRDTTLSELPFRPGDAIQLAFSRQLAHTLAINEFFTRLAAAARGDPDTELEVWWSERRCTSVWGGIVRPDGYGVWRDHHTSTSFFVEIDLGTEPLETLVGKVNAYRHLAHSTSINTLVLFQLPGPRREYGLHRALATAFGPHTSTLGGPGTASAAGVPIATTTSDLTPGPAGPVWLPFATNGTRVHLAQLAPFSSIISSSSPAPHGGQQR